MAWSLLAHAAARTTGVTATTAAIDTTGASLLVIAAVNWISAGAVTPTDSKGNTWTKRTPEAAGSSTRLTFWTCAAPTVGAGHTFALSTPGQYQSLAVAAFGGETTFTVEGLVAAVGNGVPSPQVNGSVLPSANGALVITACGWDPAQVLSVSSPLTITDQVNYQSGTSFGVAMAATVQSTAASVAPVWSWASGTANITSLALAVSPPGVPPPTGPAVAQWALDTVTGGPTPPGVAQFALDVVTRPLPTPAVAQWALEAVTGGPTPPGVAQWALDVVTRPPTQERLAQWALDVVTLSTTAGPGSGGTIVLLIDGVVRTGWLRYPFRLDYALGTRGRAQLEIYDPDSFETAYRPDVLQRVELRNDTRVLFRGTILGVEDVPLGAPGVGTVTRISAVDDWLAAGQRRVTKTYAAGLTLHALVADLTTSYLAIYGITLDPTMGTGPTLEAQTFDAVTLEEAFNRLVDASGWVYRLRPLGVIEWFAVGSRTRTFRLSAENKNIVGAVTWTKTLGQYANRIILRYGTGLVGKSTLWYGDGVTVRFTPDYPPTFVPLAIGDAGRPAGWVAWMTYVGGPYPGPPPPPTPVPPLGGGGHEGISILPATTMPWWWDPTTGEFVRQVGAPIPHPPGDGHAPIPKVGDYFWVDYNVQFPLTVIAESPEALILPFEMVLERPDIFDKAQAQAFAESQLAKFSDTPRVVTFKTRATDDFLPGDAVFLDVPSRTIPMAKWLITEVGLTTDADGKLTTTLQLLENGPSTTSWVDFWRNLVGAGATASGSLTPPPASGGGGGDGALADRLTALELVVLHPPDEGSPQ